MAVNEQHRRNSCEGKRSFQSHDIAERALKSRRRFRKGRERDHAGLRVYRCAICKSWHIGNHRWLQ